LTAIWFQFFSPVEVFGAGSLGALRADLAAGVVVPGDRAGSDGRAGAAVSGRSFRFLHSPSAPISEPAGHALAMQRPFRSIWRGPHSSGQTRPGFPRIASSSSIVGSASPASSFASLANFLTEAVPSSVGHFSSTRPA
jgi:hypothetical protein